LRRSTWLRKHTPDWENNNEQHEENERRKRKEQEVKEPTKKFG
jgi:hypothetical protein